MSLNESNGLVWKRSSNNSESDEDVWDDRALITTYDRAVRRVNALIGDKRDAALNNAIATNDDKQSRSWRSGHFCRAVYDEDRREYEAQIISINTLDDTCVVKYVGYGNEELKPLSELKPSLGKRSRKSQLKCCQSEDTASDTDTHDTRDTSGPHCQPSHSAHTSRSMPSMPSLPPPPTLPFSRASDMPEDEESLASMLMSWYMSGYHTGYYRALKHSRVDCKCKRSK